MSLATPLPIAIAPSPQPSLTPIEASSKSTKRSKGFGETKEAVIKKREWKFRQHWDALKQDFLLKDRSGDITYEGYAPSLNLASSTILLQGWLGAGKTEALVRTLAVIARYAQIIWLSPRNGLLRQSAERLKLAGVIAYHYQDDVLLHQNMLRTGQPGVFMMAPDSLKPYMIEHTKPENLILVVDEFNGVRSEITSKRTEFPGFEKLLSEAKQVIAVDAFLSDVDVAILKRYRSGDFSSGQARIYRQRFQKSTKPVRWLECLTKPNSKEDQTLSFSHEGLFIPLLNQWVDQQIGDICIAVDSKAHAKSFKLHLESLGRKPLLICADTPDESQPFMEAPDKVWAQSDYDVLIYTPTAQSGLDVQSYFERGLLISNGVISPLQMLQMMGRCRQCKEWFISAPRRSIEPATVASSFSRDKIRNWVHKLSPSLDQLGISYSNAGQSWGIWQEVTRSVEQAFNSEYLRGLLDHFFENVSEQVVEIPDVNGFRLLIKEAKRQDATLEMMGDLELGRKLLNEKKLPSKDFEVWSVKLAQTVEKYPLTEAFIEQFRQDRKDGNLEDATGMIEIFQLFTNNRLNRLKAWVLAQKPEAIKEIQDLLECDPVAYNSGLFKLYKNLRLFNELNLEQLAVFSRGSDSVVDQTHFSVRSPIVAKLWEQFKSSDLMALFPTVEAISDFWGVIRKCMTSMGFQGAGKTIRVKTEEVHSNGVDRNGKQRYSQSQSVYFSAWYIMKESGSEIFRDWFDTIIEAVNDLVEREREYRFQTVERKQSGFSPGEISAA